MPNEKPTFQRMYTSHFRVRNIDEKYRHLQAFFDVNTLSTAHKKQN